MKQICSFYLDDKMYGLDILLIQEIVRCQEITVVPHSPVFVDGLINLRGQIVVAVNLRNLLEINSERIVVDPINIILSSKGEFVSLIADRAGDVFDFGSEPILAPPKSLKGNAVRVIKGIHKLEQALVHILDPEAIFEIRSKSESKHLSQISG